MKFDRSTILLAVILCAVPLTAQPPQSPSRPDARSIPQNIGARATELEKALRHGDSELFSKLTAEDTILIDSHGLVTRADAIKNAYDVTLSSSMIQGIGNQLPPPSTTSGFTAYKLTRTRTVQGELVTTVAYVSSVWVQREGQLVCIFRQETVAAQ